MRSPLLTLFTKSRCALCDVLKEELKTLGVAARIVQVDINAPGNAAWKKKYQTSIPVLHINGLFAAKAPVDLNKLKADLQSAQAGFFEAAPGDPNSHIPTEVPVFGAPRDDDPHESV
eukprot:m.13191 g.13191  ORF g.13191 m.13191 type:complete len:117 (+) comp7275_c0_seq1:1157-1507(+)